VTTVFSSGGSVQRPKEMKEIQRKPASIS
jgi:hypothetical protein